MKPLLISASSYSRGGKNTFCSLVSAELKTRFNIDAYQLSFAHQLRVDTQDFLKKCGFDVWSDEDKEMFRPVLIWYASLKRKETNGRYFLDKTKEWMERTKHRYDVFLLSDLRFKQNSEYDELDWCLSSGPVVHISKYKLINGLKHFDTPPNQLEATNDPIIKAAATFRIEWEDSDGDTTKLDSHIKTFVNWLDQNKYLDGRKK